jgi:hypothetical protein
VDWIVLAQDKNRWRAFVNSVLNLRVSYNTGKLLSSCTTEGFSSRPELHGVSKLVRLNILERKSETLHISGRIV